jgi:hypothetical protein
MVTIRIYIKPYLAAYLKAHYAYCVVQGAIRFSKNQNIYSCLLKLTVPRPKGVSWKEEGNVTLALPCPAVGKDPRTYNYLNAESREKFEKEVNYEMGMDRTHTRGDPDQELLPLAEKTAKGKGKE